MSGVYYGLDLVSGRLGSRERTVYKFGHAEDVGTSPEDVWEGSTSYPWPTTAQTLEAVSTSANDTAAGTGMRTIRVYGLDANHEEIQEDITMNGASASAATTQSFLRVFRVRGITCGTGGSNAGTISVRVSGGGTVLGYIEFHGGVLGMGQSQMSVYTVPANHRAYLVRGAAGVEANKTVDFIMMRRTYDSTAGTWGPWRAVETGLGLTSGAAFDMAGAVAFEEKEDLKVTVIAGQAGTRVTASYVLALERFR